jgi:hypothetical protein
MKKVYFEEGQWILYMTREGPAYVQLIKQTVYDSKTGLQVVDLEPFGPGNAWYVSQDGMERKLDPEKVIRVFPKADFRPEAILASEIKTGKEAHLKEKEIPTIEWGQENGVKHE